MPQLFVEHLMKWKNANERQKKKKRERAVLNFMWFGNILKYIASDFDAEKKHRWTRINVIRMDCIKYRCVPKLPFVWIGKKWMRLLFLGNNPCHTRAKEQQKQQQKLLSCDWERERGKASERTQKNVCCGSVNMATHCFYLSLWFIFAPLLPVRISLAFELEIFWTNAITNMAFIYISGWKLCAQHSPIQQYVGVANACKEINRNAICFYVQPEMCTLLKQIPT